MCARTRAHVCMYVCACMCVHESMCECVCIVCICVCIYIVMCVHVCKYRHTCTMMHVLRSENSLGYWFPLVTLFDSLLSTDVHTKLASSQVFESPPSAAHLPTKELRLLTCTTSSSSVWVWGPTLRSSYFQEKSFIHLVIP